MGTKPWDAVILERDQAPGLYAFVDDLRPLVGTRRPHLLALSGDYNAATMPIGWRQRRLVVIGVPLWDQLGPQERVAIVCHELGHDLHGNIVHGPLVSYSIRTLSTWYRVLATNPGRLRNRSIIPELVLGALGAGVKRLLRLQIRLARRGSPLGEYLADEASARVASSEAALKGLESTLIASSATQFINFHISRRNADVLGASRKSISGLTARQRERAHRAAKLRRHTVDASHPPTLLRMEMVRKMAVVRPAFVLDSARSAQLDAEVDAVRDRLDELLLQPRRRHRRKM